MSRFMDVLTALQATSVAALGQKPKFGTLLFDEKGVTKLQLTMSFDRVSLKGRIGFSTGSGADENEAVESLRLNFLSMLGDIQQAEEKDKAANDARFFEVKAKVGKAVEDITSLATPAPEPEPGVHITFTYKQVKDSLESESALPSPESSPEPEPDPVP